ncbi:hypothetical protein O0L34_g3034 [Tuta absoluta]|nr:hypothetical protein O0L34_g3034 [Tuta absoluta]
MWMTNTAATTMVVPINFALLKVFEDQGLLNTYDITPHGDLVASDFTTCYFCAATFSATIGGVGTLIGTATNLVFKGLLEASYPNVPEYLSFPLFSGFSIPYMIVMELLLYLAMIIKFFGFLRPSSKAARAAKISPEGAAAAKIAVEEQSLSLGKLSYHEINVMILFSIAVLLFFTRSPQMFVGWADRIIIHFEEKDKKYIRDSAVAVGMTLIMLWLPMSMNAVKSFTFKDVDELPKGRVPSVLHYSSMDDALPWSFMFLLGGGFAISEAAGPKYSDLNGVIGDYLSKLSGLPNSVIVLILIISAVLLTNLASNVAVATVFVPIGMTIASKVGANPLLYNLASGLAASYCFMLPVGTPGNLIVQGAARIATKQMILAGIAPTIITVLITWGAMFGWAPIIWSDLKMDVNNLTWTETQKY